MGFLKIVKQIWLTATLIAIIWTLISYILTIVLLLVPGMGQVLQVLASVISFEFGRFVLPVLVGFIAVAEFSKGQKLELGRGALIGLISGFIYAVVCTISVTILMLVDIFFRSIRMGLASATPEGVLPAFLIGLLLGLFGFIILFFFNVIIIYLPYTIVSVIMGAVGGEIKVTISKWNL